MWWQNIMPQNATFRNYSQESFQLETIQYHSHLHKFQNLPTCTSPNNTITFGKQNSSNATNKLAEAITASASKQQPQALSALFKPLTINKLVSYYRNEKFELFENPFGTTLQMQTEMTELLKKGFFQPRLWKKIIADFQKTKHQC